MKYLAFLFLSLIAMVSLADVSAQTQVQGKIVYADYQTSPFGTSAPFEVIASAGGRTYFLDADMTFIVGPCDQGTYTLQPSSSLSGAYTYVYGACTTLPKSAQQGSATYTTSQGVVLRQVDMGAGQKGWQFPDGSVWSSYQGDFTNTGSLDANGLMINSPANAACAKIGAILPSLAQYGTMMNYFGDNGQVLATNDDFSDFLFIFPDAQGPVTPGNIEGANRIFWTSTAVGVTQARTVEGVDLFGDFASAQQAAAVRCVRPAPAAAN
jgi:hypothetical protein